MNPKNSSKRILVAGLAAVFGLGLLGVTAVARADDDAKRDDNVSEVSVVDPEDDDNDDTNTGTGNDVDQPQDVSQVSRSSDVSRNDRTNVPTRDKAATQVSHNQDASRDDNSAVGADADSSRDWSRDLTNERSKDHTR
ncbi:MAG: hypothetical protein GEU96_04660 [Propionibacteriales bacterium]|nr:hypothetical protein [Propionibacteriales bacterium]